MPLRGRHGRAERRNYKGERGICEIMDTFITLIVVPVSWVYIYKIYQRILLKYVQFIICLLYFNKTVKKEKTVFSLKELSILKSLGEALHGSAMIFEIRHSNLNTIELF